MRIVRAEGWQQAGKTRRAPNRKASGLPTETVGRPELQRPKASGAEVQAPVLRRTSLPVRAGAKSCGNVRSRGEALVPSMSRDEIHQPRWPAFVAMLAAAFVYLALPEPLSLGPSWLLLAITMVLLVPIVATYRRGHYHVSRALTFVANGVITIGLIGSLIFLIQGLPQHREQPKTLLRSASALWVTNIL